MLLNFSWHIFVLFSTYVAWHLSLSDDKCDKNESFCPPRYGDMVIFCRNDYEVNAEKL